MILYNSENSICDVRRFCCPLFYHRSVAKYLSYSSEAVMRLDHQILLKSPPLYIAGWIRPWIRPWNCVQIVMKSGSLDTTPFRTLATKSNRVETRPVARS